MTTARPLSGTTVFDVGEPGRPRTGDERELVEAMIDFRETHLYWPTSAWLRPARAGLPSLSTVDRRFGGWTAIQAKAQAAYWERHPDEAERVRWLTKRIGAAVIRLETWDAMTPGTTGTTPGDLVARIEAWLAEAHALYGRPARGAARRPAQHHGLRATRYGREAVRGRRTPHSYG